MKIILIISVFIIVLGVLIYPKYGRKEWYRRCEVNSKHPDWTPYCGIDFLKKDPQWFVKNGYGKYVK